MPCFSQWGPQAVYNNVQPSSMLSTLEQACEVDQAEYLWQAKGHLASFPSRVGISTQIPQIHLDQHSNHYFTLV